MSQFHAATVKLTAWYLAVLMTVSLAFSVVIYNISAYELDRPFSQDRFGGLSIENEAVRLMREVQAAESKRNLVINLVILNSATLALGAGASYVFAKRTLHPIEEAMEAQSRFVSDASHELRTPLAVMRTENEIALRGKNPTAAGLTSVLKSNLEEVDRLQQLTDRLLALSSEQSLPLAAFDVESAAAEAIARHRLAAKQKKIKIKTDTENLQAMGDVDTVCDIVSILIDNAIKYSPASTTVTVSTYEQNRKAIISVADEGAGVKDEDKEKVFERFYRTDESRSKANVEGHGLGLALARRLSELNHAHLSVTDREPHGAVFVLELDKA